MWVTKMNLRNEQEMKTSHHLYESLDKPVVFAHRGASRYAPENTLSSFRRAIEVGAKAIEMDVMLTKDKKIVVIHDVEVSRTTNGKGRVDEMEYDALKKLDAGGWFSNKFEGEKIPLLEEVLNEVGGDILINIELKNYHSPNDDLASRVFDLVNHNNFDNSIFISSFLPRNLKIIHSLDPELPFALLTLPGIKGFLFRSCFFKSVSPFFIHPSKEDVTKKMIAREHAQKRRVHTYTVNEPKQMQLFFEWGVDGIFTDDPIMALEIKKNL